MNQPLFPPEEALEKEFELLNSSCEHRRRRIQANLTDLGKLVTLVFPIFTAVAVTGIKQSLNKDDGNLVLVLTAANFVTALLICSCCYYWIGIMLNSMYLELRILPRLNNMTRHQSESFVCFVQRVNNIALFVLPFVMQMAAFALLLFSMIYVWDVAWPFSNLFHGLAAVLTSISTLAAFLMLITTILSFIELNKLNKAAKIQATMGA